MPAQGPFVGLEVLDLSWGMSGQLTTMCLADLGARVIRIEPPEGAPFSDQPGYRVWNRGKERVALNLKRTDDLEVFLALADRADVLVETFSPGVTNRLGIDFAALNQRNPRLVYCSITAYGSDNIHSDRPGLEALVAARTGTQWAQRGGIMAPATLGQADVDVPDCALHELRQDGPLFSASPWMGLNGFYHSNIAIAAALHHRETSGLGQWIQTSMLKRPSSGGVRSLAPGAAPTQGSWMMLRGAPKGLFQCADGRWVHHWALKPLTVIEAAEHDSLDDAPPPKYESRRSDPNRIGMEVSAIVELFHWLPLMQDAFRRFPADAWARWGARVIEGVQVIRSPEEALGDHMLFDDGCVVEVTDPDLGPIRHLGLLSDFSETNGSVQGPMARFGEHTAAVKERVRESRIASGRGSATAPVPTAIDASGRSGPLHGVRVLDLGVALAGPYASSLLADLGADVIKVNAPWDGWWLATGIGQMANQGKRSIVLNLQDARGLEVLYDLVKTADIVLHNMRWGVAERLGIGYNDLRAYNPAIIYGQSRGFDRVRSAANLPGTDQMGSALGGQEWEDGGCGRGGRPLFGTSMGDLGNGFLLAISAIQALYHRDRTGVGQTVGTSIVNACLATASNALIRADGSGVDRAKLDAEQLGFHALYRLYETHEGWICIGALNDNDWRSLCSVLGRDGLIVDERFSSPAARAANDDALAGELAEAFKIRRAQEWLPLLDTAGVPAEASTQAFEDPNVGTPVYRFSKTPANVPGATPMLGQHTEEILRELGMAASDIETLLATGVALTAENGRR